MVIRAEFSDGPPMDEGDEPTRSPAPTLETLGERVADFVAARDWARFHSPKNLAMALSVEAAELVELFQWLTEAESGALDAETRRRAAEEIADVQIYLLQIAARLDVDIGEAVLDKLAANARKHPAR